jgi:tyrosyl-tRNA synthetase
MNTKERTELIKRNAEEIINQDKISKALKKKKKPVVYCGYEASGDIHIGHYVTILKLKDFEDAGFKVKVLIADWHTWLNKKGNWGYIKEQVKKWEKAFKKIGLKNPEIIVGTSFQKKPEYIEDVFTLASNSTLNRGLRAMQGVARDIKHAKVTQIIYPFMQVVDMKALGVDAVVSGIEQRKIHMIAVESLKDISYEVPIFVHTCLIPSLKGEAAGKMSSSDEESLISVKDSSEEIKNKILKAYCPEAKKNPVLDIARILIFPEFKKLEISRPEKFGGKVSYDSYAKLEKDFLSKRLHPLDLKKAVSDRLAEMFNKIK